MKVEKLFPERIFIDRLICSHLRELTPGKVEIRQKHLESLVALDDSCKEVLELVRLLLEKDVVDCTLCHNLLLTYLDYPSNGQHQDAWELVDQLHTSQPHLQQRETFQSRLVLWRELYPDQVKI